MLTSADVVNATYFLYGGTLLGSLRSGDILPWDDDLDLAMDFDHVDRVNSTLAILVSKGQGELTQLRHK